MRSNKILFIIEEQLQVQVRGYKMTKILDGKEVGQSLRHQARKDAETLREKGIHPKLAILRVGEDQASKSYERNAIRAMKDATIAVETVTMDESCTEDDVITMIEKLNNNDLIHGVIIMQPLPEGISRQDISSYLNPKKDVDGIHPLNLGYILEDNRMALLPNTPQAVLEMLAYYEVSLIGKDVAVIGSSPIVGKPLSLMLSNEGATVSNLHIHTKDTRKYTKQADIVISATGALGLIDETYVKEGAIVLDVGFGYTDGKIMGDVQYDAVFDKVAAISPVPGGVGSVTTSVLAAQVIKATEMQARGKLNERFKM